MTTLEISLTYKNHKTKIQKEIHLETNIENGKCTMHLQINKGTNMMKQVTDRQVVRGSFTLVNFSCLGFPPSSTQHDPKVDFASALTDTYRV